MYFIIPLWHSLSLNPPHQFPHSLYLLSQTDPDSADKSDFDWWSKYYYSIGDERRTQKDYVAKGLDRFNVYPGELEDAFNR